MKKLIYFAIFTFFIAMNYSCTKDADEVIEAIDKESVMLFTGNFVSGDHTTSGKATIVKTVDNKLFLNIENLKTDAGPDLHIYLSPDKTAKSFIDVKTAPANGTYALELDPSTDFNKNKFVLIWCKSFSVLFGSAELK
jgi:hypothetical protein